ncbi:MAG TPA: hypothetical protein PLK31_13310 [Chloroflexota bacterium]|nr:hypothetical protein [Chloroflexota bacterium]
MTAESKNITLCPDCGSEVRLRKPPYLGQLITCHHCDSVLEVVNRSPLELDWAEAAWDDDAGSTFDAGRNGRRRNGR